MERYHTVITNSDPLCGANVNSHNNLWGPQEGNDTCDAMFWDNAAMVVDPDATVVEGSCTQFQDYVSPRETNFIDSEISWKLTKVAPPPPPPDTTPPTITIDVPTDGEHFAQGANVVPVVSCADDVAVATCVPSVTVLDTSTPGTKTFTVNADRQRWQPRHEDGHLHRGRTPGHDPADHHDQRADRWGPLRPRDQRGAGLLLHR